MLGERTKGWLAGSCCAVVGLFICLVALDVLPAEAGSIHAPRWVLGLCGGVFVLCGLAIAAQRRPLLLSLLGNLIVAAFATIAAWVAIGGDSADFSGGIPLVSHDVNVTIARGVFAAGAVICGLILIDGIRYMLKRLTAH